MTAKFPRFDTLSLHAGQQPDTTTGAAVTGGTTTVSVTGDGGTYTTGSVGSGAATHKGGGYWEYGPAQAETNYDHVAFTFVNTSAITATVQVYPSFPQSVDNATNVSAIKTKTDFLPSATAGAAGGVFIAGTNAATTITTGLTTTFTGNLTGSVGSVTGAVGSVTAAITLPSIPANWITAAGITAAALNGKGDWMVTYTQPAGFLAATFPALVASSTTVMSANVTKVNGTTVNGSGTLVDPWGP